MDKGGIGFRGCHRSETLGQQQRTDFSFYFKDDVPAVGNILYIVHCFEGIAGKYHLIH